MKPQRIQLRRAKGWRMPPNTVKVDRSTQWGNPFIVGTHGTQSECVSHYSLLLGGYAVLGYGMVEQIEQTYNYVKNHITELQGKNLACWCRTGTPCHADILLQIANGII